MGSNVFSYVFPLTDPSSRAARLRLLLWVLVLFIPAFLVPATGRGAILDWDDFTSGSGTFTGSGPNTNSSLTKSFDNDATHAGNDVTITISNDRKGADLKTSSGGYVKVDNSPLTGGAPSSKNSLQYNSDSWGSTTGAVTTQIAFNYAGGVQNVSFKIYDVDLNSGTWRDKISNIYGLDLNGDKVAATVSITSGGSTTLSGSGLTWAATGSGSSGDTSTDGNVTITFTSVVTDVFFDWSNTDNGGGQNRIALSAISYTPALPEVRPDVAAVAVCGILVGFQIFFQKQRKSKEDSTEIAA